MAAHNITLLLKGMDEFHRFLPSVVSNGGVMGIRGGFLNLEPWDRFIPRMRRYRREKEFMSRS